MNPSDRNERHRSAATAEPRGRHAPSPAASTAPHRVGGGSRLGRILAIVVILAAGLLAGVTLLRSGGPSASAEAPKEGAPAAANGGGGEKKGGDHADHAQKGRVELSAEKLKNAQLGVEAAGPAKIRLQLPVFGKIGPDEERLAHVSPRFAGVVKKINKRLGDPVSGGEVLAAIESNESLQTYDLKAPIGGIVIARDVSLGEFVGTDKSLFTIADLSTVWVDFQVYRQDFAKLRVGQKVHFDAGVPLPPPTPGAQKPEAAAPDARPGGETAPDGHAQIESEIAYLSPFGAENTQSMLARAYVPNPAGALTPGLFVNGRIDVDDVEVPVAVNDAAVQTLDGKDVVFIEEGEGAFEARPVQLGRNDGERVEVTSGLRPGERYVALNSFILKAELGKEGAEED